MRDTIVITGGGTGGHLYPALSIIRHLPGGSSGLKSNLLYIGNSRGLERAVIPREGIRHVLFPMAAPSKPEGALLLSVATLRSILALWRKRPRVTLATGGYVSIPAGVASWLLRIPLVLFLPDVVPGKAVRILVPLARRIAASNEAALAHLPSDKTVVTGYPVREAFLCVSRPQGRQRFGLNEEARVLGVFGGSQGARSINQAVAAHLPALLRDFDVLHVCGEMRLAEAEAAAAALPDEVRSRYHLFPYLHEEDVAAALAACDLVVSRSGASTLGELPAAGTPAILVPLPDPVVHQIDNARYLADRGAAVIVPDDDLVAELPAAAHSLFDNPERLHAMAAACRALAIPDAAQRIAALVEGVR